MDHNQDSKRRYERWRIEHAVKKKTKRDRERFRRGKISLFKGADKLYRDGRDTGRQRYLYICILEKKSDDDPGKFFEYVSHSEDTWPPRKKEVVSKIHLTIQIHVINQEERMSTFPSLNTGCQRILILKRR